MKKLRSEIPHPAKQFRHVVQQTLGAVQLADPQREGPKHTKERLDPPFDRFPQLAYRLGGSGLAPLS